MRQFRSPFWLATFAVAAALSCGAFDPAFAQGASPGPIVAMLHDRPVFFFAADPDNNLLSLHFPPDVFLCGGGESFNLADIMFVTTPSAVQSVLALIKDDDGAVQIFATADLSEALGPGGFLSDLPLMCAFMNGPKKIAEGTARRVSAFSGESFSASWIGTLTDIAGNPVRYSEHVVFTIDPHTDARTSVRESISLR